jgi:MFS superfamily sulfate permease-like transporter
MSHTTPSAVPNTLPLTGIPGLIQNWKSDVLSGFLVFLIALPLSLGIAIASGCPPMAGIITAIIGGLLVSRISGSFVTINGPAAGLIVVILDSVQELGNGDNMAGYKYTLAAIVIASLFQTGMGLLKAGRLSAFFPSGVVHGMLAAIGIIIMSKQIHVMLGVKPDVHNLVETIQAIPSSIMHLNPGIALIGGAGLLILVLWNITKNAYVKMIPAPIIVVILGIALGQYFDLDHEHTAFHDFTLGPKFLVPLPDNFLAGFAFPDFSRVSELVFWEQVLTICLVGSLESLLSAAAVDKLDPYKRYSDLNRDLTAVGIGNTIAGMVGGLPMIAEIVRSSANINNGAKTGWANFFHGLFLLGFVGLAPGLIREIPLASLAALLVFTGYRLASPTTFIKTLHIGYEQLLIFIATIVGVLTTDLLIGVAIGMITELLIHVVRSLDWSNVRFGDAFKLYFKIEPTNEDTYTIHINGAAFFANYLALKSGLARLPDGKKLIFDFSSASSVDHTVMEFIHEYSEDYMRRGGTCTNHGLHRHSATSEHHLAARTLKRRSTD